MDENIGLVFQFNFKVDKVIKQIQETNSRRLDRSREVTQNK